MRKNITIALVLLIVILVGNMGGLWLASML